MEPLRKIVRIKTVPNVKSAPSSPNKTFIDDNKQNSAPPSPSSLSSSDNESILSDKIKPKITELDSLTSEEKQIASLYKNTPSGCKTSTHSDSEDDSFSAFTDHLKELEQKSADESSYSNFKQQQQVNKKPTYHPIDSRSEEVLHALRVIRSYRTHVKSITVVSDDKLDYMSDSEIIAYLEELRNGKQSLITSDNIKDAFFMTTKQIEILGPRFGADLRGYTKALEINKQINESLEYATAELNGMFSASLPWYGVLGLTMVTVGANVHLANTLDNNYINIFNKPIKNNDGSNKTNDTFTPTS